MNRKTSAALAIVLALGLGGLPQVGSARSFSDHGYDYNQQPTGGEMMADAVLVRPLTLAATAVGAIAWVITLPFSIPAGNAGEAGHAWVGGPLKYTFMRPLGEMEEGVEPSYVQESSDL